MKKLTRKQLIKKADKIFSEYIRKRDNYICFICGKHGNQAGHLITRSNYATRWHEQNCYCSCSGCNLAHEYHPENMTKKYIDTFGIEQYEKIYYLSKTIYKITNSELLVLINYYKEK